MVARLQSRREQLRSKATGSDSSLRSSYHSSAVGGGGGGGSAIGRSITDFVQKSASTKAQKPWQILSICETVTSATGVFKMWILVESDLYAVNLKTMRTFYVNQIKAPEKESSLCRKATKHLPRLVYVCILFLHRTVLSITMILNITIIE